MINSVNSHPKNVCFFYQHHSCLSSINEWRQRAMTQPWTYLSACKSTRIHFCLQGSFLHLWSCRQRSVKAKQIVLKCAMIRTFKVHFALGNIRARKSPALKAESNQWSNSSGKDSWVAKQMDFLANQYWLKRRMDGYNNNCVFLIYQNCLRKKIILLLLKGKKVRAS